MKKVTILVPCYNEEESLPLFYESLLKVIESIPQKYEWELLFVNDGSRDRTLQVMRNLRERDSRVSYLDLSRNFGKERAMLAGFDYVTGDCMIIMDADLQDPPELIPQMLQYWEEGYEDVYAKLSLICSKKGLFPCILPHIAENHKDRGPAECGRFPPSGPLLYQCSHKNEGVRALHQRNVLLDRVPEKGNTL